MSTIKHKRPRYARYVARVETTKSTGKMSLEGILTVVALSLLGLFIVAIF